MPISNVRGVQIEQGFIVCPSRAALEKFQPHALRAISSTRSAEGCLEYSLALDAIDDRTIRIFGHWQSEAARKAHAASEHGKALTSAFKALDPVAFNVKLFTPDEALTGINSDSGKEIKPLTPEQEKEFGPRGQMLQVVQAAFYFSSETDSQRYFEEARSGILICRKEEGALEYGYSRDIDDLKVMRLQERWSNIRTMYLHVAANPKAVPLLMSFKPGPGTGGQLFYVAPGMERDLPVVEM